MQEDPHIQGSREAFGWEEDLDEDPSLTRVVLYLAAMIILFGLFLYAALGGWQ